MCASLVGGKLVFAQGYTRVIPTDYEFQKTNIFPGQVTATGWANSGSTLSQDISEDALYGDFNRDTSAYIEQFTAGNPVVKTPTDTGVTPNEPAPAEETTPSEETVFDVPVDTSEIDTDTTPDVEITAPESIPDPEPTSEEEVTPESVQEAPETSNESPDAGETVSSAVFEMVRGAYSFAATIFSSEEQGAEEAVAEPTPAAASDAVPEEVVVTEPEVLGESTTVPAESVVETSADQGDSDEVAEDVLETIPEITTTGEPAEVCEYIGCFSHVIEFADFSVGDGFDEQQITNIQLRMSLGALPHSKDSVGDELLRVEYFHDGEWMQGGLITIDDEVSNALNGGYQLFAFPIYDQWTELKDVKVRISYGSDNENLSTVYLDSVWLEVESINGNAFNESPDEPPVLPPTTEQVLRQDVPEGYALEITEEKKDFAFTEDPRLAFKLLREEQKLGLLARIGEGIKSFFGFRSERNAERPLALRIVNEELRDHAEIIEKGDGAFEVAVSKARQFKPGKYIVTIEVSDENGTFYIDQEFSWGVLAINTDKSIYAQGENAHLQMGVLDDFGHTICDAELELEITSPSGVVTMLSTTNGQIAYGAECAGDTFTTTPDYDAHYRIEDRTGRYGMKLTATTPNGVHTISDAFEVREAVAFDVTRTGPTRIYPPALYPVTLSITANEDYKGEIIEYVPQSFQVYESDESDIIPFRTHEEGDAKQLIWEVSLLAGETIELAYEFDAPDISPEFYLLGPLQVGDFAEIREWQIASDAPDPARIIQSVVGAVADATVYTATLPGAVTIGNVIIMAAIHRDNAVSFAAPGGFTQAVYSDSANFIDVGIWYKVATSTLSTYSISKPTGGVESGMIVLMEVDGLDTADLLDVVASNDQTATNARIAFTGATAQAARYGFAVAISGWGDDDFTNPTTASWTSSSTDAYTQLAWQEWATSNAGSFGVAYAHINAVSVQGARLTVTGGGSTEDRNSAIAVFNLAPQITTVSTIGNQVTPLIINRNNQYVGGAFTLVPDSGTTTVTGITITETGTTDAQNDLSGIKLKYEMDSTAPYDCASVSYAGTETQYGATSTSFTSANGTATFNGSVTIASTSAMCVYPVVNIDSSATDGHTIELQIATPSSQVVVNEGTVTPGTAVSISDTTTISIGYSPNTPNLAATPAFESYRATTTMPRLGGFAATDPDGNNVQYGIIIDDNQDLSSPITTKYSSNYPTDGGWASTTFASAATTTYIVRSTDGLTAGSTYWWGVKARDPSNTNRWSATSTARSFTIGSSITVPEWYQTTYEQLNQNTFTNTLATTSGSVIIASTTQSFNWLTTPVDVSPGTSGTWVTVDVSANVPVGATGVILRWDISNSGADRALGFRHGDSTDNRITTVEVEKADFAYAGLNSSRQFDAYVGANTVDVYLVGYTTNGVTFFTNSSNKTLPSNSTWGDISIATDTGADTAIGAIVEIVHATNNDTWGMRKNGSTDNRTAAYGRYHNWAIIGVDGSEIFEGWANDITDTTFHVIGYVTSGATFFTNAVDRTPSPGVGWVDVDITGDLVPGDNAIGAFVEVYGTDAVAAYGLRKNGDTSTGNSLFEDARRHAWGAIAVDDDDIYEAQLEAASIYTNSLIGYATANAEGSVMSDPVDFDHVSNQNDWGEVRWTVTEPAGSDTYVQVYYGASCNTLVPNGTLPGNAVGFAATTSPINISGLSTSTYNQICIKATLDQGTAGESPSLDSWNISWERKPVYAQESYWWYVNTNANTPTDRWPAGATDLAISTPISSTNPTKTNDVLRLRMGVGVSSVTASAGVFKLQYAAGETCSAGLEWFDVGAIGSTTALWRGYNNAAVSDGATLTSQLLTGADELESYEEENLTASLANAIVSGDTGEWDFVLQNRALPGASYCFRMVGSDGELLATYTNYPQAVTNFAPVVSVYDTPFDNEKIATTTPVFEFYATDAEEDDVDYQIQIDNDVDFSSTAIDTNSASNANDFENLATPADKSPFTQNERIRYTIPSALTNGTTYWWRVRSKDPNGSDTYGEWSELQSFTVDTTVTIATWFQTTEEQFDTDTLENTDATASDLVNMPNSSPGTTTSQTIDFDDADTGNAWGSLSWTDNETTGDIKYHVEYYNGSAWALIPNTALPSNSTGFDTSPVDLIDLDTEIYNQIRIRANFTYSGGSPTLSDWTVSWGERVSVVTHMTLFDNEKTGTTSPTFTFTTTDPQGQDLEYEISYSTDATFTTGTTTRRSNIHPGFTNLTSGGDTNPFDSGDTISYKVQSALTNGTTYWWRVRAKDPAGSNSYSFWSDPWSFTVDTTVGVSTWFQTTQEQFETDTLTGVVASTTDQLTMLPPGVSTYNFVGVTNPSATHVARDFEVDVLDPTDPPTVDALDTITTTGTTGGAPNLRTGIAGYASDAQATNVQYTSISTSNNTRWQITDPGAGDNAIFWASFLIDESPNDINQIDVLLEGYQAAAVDKGWLAIWRPGASTPYWQVLDDATQTSDFSYTGSLTTNLDEYVDSSNRVHIMFFNEDDSDSLFVDYVEIEVTSGAATEGTAVSSAIDYNDGSGPAWGRMLWSDTTPGASNILYQLQYLDSFGDWTLVPDGALTGNSAGFTTAPIDLQSLNTTTYNEVRMVANVDCSGINCPSLQDWTLEWSEGFDISGTAVEYNGTASTTSGTVGVAVNGVLQIGKTGTILANGTWTIDNVTFYAGDTITVFVSGAADADEAVAVTTYDGTPGITGMRLQKRFVTIGSNDNGTITNADVGEYQFTDDEDLFYSVSADDLDMCATTGCFDAGIAVLAGDTYSPGTGADILTHDLINNGTFIPGSNSVRLSGSWDNNATSTMTGSTVIFTATSTTESIDQTGAVTTAFNNVTFGETSGAATWNLVTALDVDGNLNVTYGTLGRNTQVLTVAGNLTTAASGFWTGIGTTTFDGTNPSTWTDNNATDQNIGRVLVDGTSKTLLLGSGVLMQSMTIGANDTFDLGITGFTASVYRNWINNNTFTPRTGTVVFIATSTNRVITVGGDAFYNLQFNGTGASWSFTEAALTVSNDLTFTAGTVTMPTGTTTLTGSFVTAGGTFAHNNSLVYFNSSAAETITLQGTAFTNALYNARFTGSGSWTFTEAFATTSNRFQITQGTVTLPSNTLTVGGSFTNSAGSFAHNNGTVKFTASGAQTIDTNASFNNMLFTGSGSWSFVDASLTALGDITVSNGTLTLPSGTFTVGGGIVNTATLTHNNGTVLFNSADTGETISLGNSSLYNATFNSATGGWTISSNATTTNNTTLTAANTFTLTSGRTLSVGGTFTNSVGGASTTWTGSTLSLEAGNYTLNTKTNTGDVYNILRIKANTDIKMWNSSASTYTVDATGSLYSQDHSAVDGDLYIYGNYPRTSGTEHWSYATDFDGTALGGSSRQVDVRFASGASASFSNSTLSVIGTGVASTTIANQGSGTYTIGITAGTTTMNRYDFDNLGATGITFSGQTVVTSLSYGAFTPSVAAGAALSIASSSIDRNPGLQIFNVDFSTTTAISAFNVAQTSGVPTSYWWFRQSTGNIDGEARDNDTGDPGSIRWDDSSLVITVSGTVYGDDGVTPLSNPTCDGATAVVRIVVENGSAYTGDCDSGTGDFSIGGVTIVGDPVVTTYLDTNGGVRGTVVTKTPTADITDLDIYANRVMTRHEDILPLTIEDMAVFDSSNDSDVRFTAATGTVDTLTLPFNTELHVASSTTFAPGGAITINANATGNSYDGSFHIDNNATFTAHASSTISLGGSFTVDAGGVFTAASSTVLMTATTTGKTVTGVTPITFNQLTWSGVGGGWNINTDITAQADIYVQNGTVTGTEDITLTNGSFYGNGTLSLGSGTTTLYRTNTLGGTSSWTFANLVLGNGSFVGTTTPASSATTTILGRLTIGAAHVLDAGDANFELRGTGNTFVETGTFLEDTSNVRYGGTSGSNVLSTRYYDLDINAIGGTPTFTASGSGIQVTNNLSVGGTAPTTFTLNTNDPALDVNGNVTIRSNGTFIGSNSASTTIAGNYDNDGTFTGSGGTLTFDGSASTNIAAGSSAFSSVRINGTGTFTISENATTSSAFTLTNAGSFTLNSGITLAVAGSFTNAEGDAATTWTGSTLRLVSGTNYQINAKTINDVYNVLVVGANTDIRMWNSSASTYTVDSTGSLYSQDHSAVDGDLYIYGNYPGNAGTDHWSYATDFDGTALGGSSRQVDVRFASGASAVLTNGGLSVLGNASASTSLQNQGSGTYGVRIGGSASTTWSYYDVEDMNTSGLVFSGTPNVVTLSRGDIEVSVGGGSAITVGGSVINANPAKNFTNNVFATTTGISAFNVTATGTTVSSWRFTNHSGQIDGEAYDVDPDGDPGYIVWDNSAANISISGNVYSDEGVTVSSICGGTSNIRLVVAGLSTYDTTCNAGTGLYTFTGVSYSPADSLVVYINGETAKAAAVTADPVSNITGLHLYENRVIVRHENTGPLTIDDMAVYDSSDDADIPFTAVSGAPDTLTLPANRKLIVWTNKEFEPNGNVTVSGGGGGAAYDGTLELLTGATFDANGTEVHTIGGSLISGSTATVDDDTSTFTFTTTGAARTIDANDNPFYNLTFNGSGSWNVTDTVLTVGNDLTITQGAVTLPAATTTITGSLLNTGGSFVASGGTMIFNSAAAETIRPNTSNFATLLINGTGSFAFFGAAATTTNDLRIIDGVVTAPTGPLTVGGDFVNDDTFTHNSGTIRMTSGTAGTLLTLGGSDASSVTFAGAGSFIFTDGSAALLGTLRITQGAVTLATGTLSVAGSFLNTGGSFAHASGTILFNSSDAGETVNPGSSLFYAVNVAAPTGGYTFTNHATTTGNFSITSATNFVVSSGVRLAVRGVFTNLVGGSATTWTGSTLAINSGSNYTINTKTLGGDVYNRLSISSNTDLRMWNSSATTTVDTTSSLYSQDNAAVNGALYIYGDYERTTGTDYWSYATDFDGASLTGSERAVTVSMAENATTTLSGGTLSMVGAALGTTTVTNQGTGTFTLDIQGGTLNAQYYAMRNMDRDGLRLSGTTTVSSLAYGDYVLAVNGGSLITLASTTLNQNASLIIPGTRFATTTAITGANVEVVGTTPSAWTFTAHRGNFDGEAFDIDGVDACGSIRWSDSACLLTQQSGFRWRNDDGGEGVPDSEWFDTDWGKRKRVEITNADASVYTNAAVKFTVAYDADMQADFDDLRFTDSSGTTTLSHFIETYTASTDAVVWVKVPSLAASSDTEIYMYYSNGAVADASVGTTTFTYFDGFEDDNITEYSGDTSLFNVGTDFNYEGTYGLDALGNESAKATDGIFRTDVTISQGQTIRYWQYIDAAGSQDEVCTLFGIQTPGTGNDNYGVCLEQVTGVDRISISRDVESTDTEGTGTILASSTVAYSVGWYEVEVDWDIDDTIFVSLYDASGSLVATTSATSVLYTSGGIGFTFWFQNGGWDTFSARPLVETDPVVSFGYEQVSGGASWIADLNELAPGVSQDDTVRARFLIENTGLTVTDQNYIIEFAEKGGAPSCEAVNYNDYVEVPNQASCGSSPICLQASSQFTNGAGTTDVLGGIGSFTPGEIREDPANATGNITVDNDEYTELEYAITPTTNATDSNYCFRVTDSGSELDSYTEVAELELRFDPVVSTIVLNGGQPITLTPGATTTVSATGTVSDQNGYADLDTASSTMYRSGVTGGAACSANNNDCYISSGPQCSFSNCAGNSCDISCTADIYFFADPTDAGTYSGQNWLSYIEVSDQSGGIDIGSSPGIELMTLRAIGVNNVISYGSLAVSADTGSYNPTTTVENIGNDNIDVSLEGTDLTDGGSSVIPVTEQLYATSTFTYAACTVCNALASTSVNYEVDLSKPTTTTPVISDVIYWGIEIPFGTAGTAHQGTNLFTAIGDI